MMRYLMATLMKQIRNPKSSEPQINADFTDFLRS